MDDVIAERYARHVPPEVELRIHPALLTRAEADRLGAAFQANFRRLFAAGIRVTSIGVHDLGGRFTFGSDPEWSDVTPTPALLVGHGLWPEGFATGDERITIVPEEPPIPMTG